MRSRIAITGIGVVSAFGAGRDAFWTQHQPGGQRHARHHRLRRVHLSLPRRCRRAATRRSGSSRCSTASTAAADTRADPRRYSRAALFGVLAAREAWNDAGLRFGEPGAGVIIGSGGGGIDVGEQQYKDFFTNDGRHVTPYAIALGICGMVSSEISISLGLHGISHVLSTGCTSSTDAIGYARMLLLLGESDVLLSGGTDGCVLPGMIFGFSRMRAVSTALQRSPGRGLAPVRSRPRRLRARRRRLDGRARARGSGAGPRRAHLCHASKATPRPAMPITACRWIPTAPRSCAACSTALAQAGTRAGGDRLRQLSRHLDAAERRDRVAVHAHHAAVRSRIACRGRPPSR